MFTSFWPLQSHLELGALPTAVACARLHARLVLWEWGMEDHAGTVELVVSELVTNAIRASEGLMPGVPAVRLWLSSDGDRVVVQVWDGNHRMPVRQDAQPEAESGRGLLLVDTLSVEWGSYEPENRVGKWFGRWWQARHDEGPARTGPAPCL
jgi:anti-sigma regulatory factor (Ser/Thr protein kinase)